LLLALSAANEIHNFTLCSIKLVKKLVHVLAMGKQAVDVKSTRSNEWAACSAAGSAADNQSRSSGSPAANAATCCGSWTHSYTAAHEPTRYVIVLIQVISCWIVDGHNTGDVLSVSSWQLVCNKALVDLVGNALLCYRYIHCVWEKSNPLNMFS